MPRLGYLILAAGKGTRMHVDSPKVMQTILGKPLLGYVYDSLCAVPRDLIWTVVGFKAEEISAQFSEDLFQFVYQNEQLGTGHAVSVAWPAIEQRGIEYLCVVNGDTPSVPVEEISGLMRACAELDAALGFVTLHLDNPFGYGRVLRSASGEISHIVEQKDFDVSAGEEIHEVNAGIYVLNVARCGPFLASLDAKNAQKEFYITQLVSLCLNAGLRVLGSPYTGSAELMGINTPKELLILEERKRRAIVDQWIEAGVLIRNAVSVVIGPDVSLEPGVEITGPCEIYGRSRLECGTSVESHCWINAATLRACQVKSFSHIEKAEVLSGACIGPYARLRPGTVVGERARVGNFVEVKNTVLHAGAKASHLTYLGDSEIGVSVNIGAGTITCNYDGTRKHQTQIRDNAFIGSNTALVAPVIVGTNAVVGAGSVVTKDVPDNALCVARSKQINLEHKKKSNTP